MQTSKGKSDSQIRNGSMNYSLVPRAFLSDPHLPHSRQGSCCFHHLSEMTSEMVPNLNLTPRTRKINCGLFRSSDLPNSSKHKFANPVRHRNSSKSEHVLKPDLLS